MAPITRLDKHGLIHYTHKYRKDSIVLDKKNSKIITHLAIRLLEASKIDIGPSRAVDRNLLASSQSIGDTLILW